jgi:hypothetical protein
MAIKGSGPIEGQIISAGLDSSRYVIISSQVPIGAVHVVLRNLIDNRVFPAPETHNFGCRIEFINF